MGRRNIAKKNGENISRWFEKAFNIILGFDKKIHESILKRIHWEPKFFLQWK